MRILYILYFFYIKETFQLIIPMKKEIFSNNLSQEEILNNKLYISIKIGNPSQIIKSYINSETHIIFISENKTLQGTDNKNLSKTYSQKSNILKFTINNYKNEIFGFDSKEIFYINKTEVNISFILTKNISNKIEFNSSILRFKINPNPLTEQYNFISQLHKNKLINLEIFFFNYINENKRELIIGKYPHEISSNYNKKYLNIYYIKNPLVNLDYEILFDNIHYFNINDTSLYAKFSFDFEGIIGSRFSLYKLNKTFFEPLFKNKICEIEIINNGFFYAYKCNKFLKVENFKSIFFHSKQLNYTFELNYNDLFLYRNEFYYFLIYFKVNLGDTRWFLGQIFLKKYLIVFDQEKAFLGYYYNNNNNKNYNISYFKIFPVLLNIILIIILIQLFKKKQRKKRINEIEMDYKNNLL